MEPRLLRRGNPLCRQTSELLQARFNGATPSQTWKRKYTPIHEPPVTVLQWSHAFSDVETASLASRLCAIAQLQWSHAFSDVETRCPADSRNHAAGFNGATPSQTWKPLQKEEL